MTNGKKILLIEDDANAIDLYKEVLRNAGFSVISAIDGGVGLSKAQEGGYDLILLDIMLPKMDGLTVLSKLKESPAKRQNGPIILLTNLAHDPVIQEATKLGAVGYLTKSDINPDQLVKKVREYLKKTP